MQKEDWRKEEFWNRRRRKSRIVWLIIIGIILLLLWNEHRINGSAPSPSYGPSGQGYNCGPGGADC